MKNIIVFMLSFGVLFYSCTKEVEIEIPQEKHKMVAYSTIAPFILPTPKPLKIKLQSSLHIFDKSEGKIEDATVLYFENNVLKDTFKYIGTDDIYTPTHSNHHPIEGNIYSIQISKEGFETIQLQLKYLQK